jgi:hypothetical protein
MKYQAICPVCNEKISRWGVWSEKARCKTCGASLCQKHDAQYYLSCIGFMSLCLLFFYLSLHSLLFIPSLLYIVLLMHLLFPYLTQYKVDETVKRAGVCGIIVRIMKSAVTYISYLITIGIWLGFSYCSVRMNWPVNKEDALEDTLKVARQSSVIEEAACQLEQGYDALLRYLKEE